MKVFSWDRSDTTMFNDGLMDIVGIPPRFPDEEITEDHKNVAASVQRIYEKILFDLIKDNREPDFFKITLGGGCAYNGSANGKLLKNFDFDQLWIPPAPSDAGSCIGACINYIHRTTGEILKINQSPFLGPSFSDDNLSNILNKESFTKFDNTDDMTEFVAKEIQNGKVRPFAPSVVREFQSNFFEMNGDIPYMNQVVKVKEEYKKILDSVTHIDGTARVHTVYEGNLFHKLLSKFEKLSGYPVLLNTSFNVKDKTMVLTPQDALETFENVDIDILVINNYLIQKK